MPVIVCRSFRGTERFRVEYQGRERCKLYGNSSPGRQESRSDLSWHAVRDSAPVKVLGTGELSVKG